MEAETGAKPYQTLEQQILDLWMSHGLKVLEEKFERIGKGKFRWTIIAEEEQRANDRS